MSTSQPDNERRLLRETRWQRILAAVQADGAVSVDELATHFGVSSMTIRRDLLELAEQGRLERVHGGAIAPSTGISYVPADDRVTQHADRKQSIAAAAAALVPAGTSVLLAGGTTVGELAKLLIGRQLTVVTDSLIVLEALGPDDNTEVHVLGGRYRSETRTFIGPTTLDQIKLYRAEWAFLGASAVTNGEYFHYYPDDRPLQHAMIESANHPWLLVDGSKFDAPALGRVGDISEFDGIITDPSAEPTLDAATKGRRHLVRIAPLAQA